MISESSVLQLALKALILDVIHNLEVVKQLMEEQVSDPEGWAWQRQLRFYLRPGGICHIRMVDAEFLYTYEYQVGASLQGIAGTCPRKFTINL